MKSRSRLSMIVREGDTEEMGRPREFRKKTYRLREWVADAMSLIPHGPDILGIWGKKRLDPAFREEIMVAVARANQCRYCNYVHSWWAMRAGLPREELEKIEVGDTQSPDTRSSTAVAYAQELARLDFQPPAEDLRDLLAGHFNRQECEDIETVARVMTLMNRTGNTLDALLSRLKGEPSRHSGIADELVIGLGFLLVVPWMIVALSALQARSPLAVANDFRAFSRKFEQEIAASSKPRLRSVKAATRKGRASA